MTRKYYGVFTHFNLDIVTRKYSMTRFFDLFIAKESQLSMSLMSMAEISVNDVTRKISVIGADPAPEIFNFIS